MHTRALVTTFALALLFTAATAAQTDNWVTVSPPGAAFLIKMPGQPEKKDKEGVTQYYYSEHNKPDRWLITILGWKSRGLGTSDAEAVVRKEIEEFAEGFEGKVVSTRRRDYAKDSPAKPPFTGLEAVVTREGYRCLVAAYDVNLFGRKSYVMSYCATEGRYSRAEAEQFLDSFVLLRQ